MKLELISRYPSGNAHATPLLFLHGAWHGAWCWDVHFLDYFAQQGYAAHAVSLRGHGNSEGHNNLRWLRIADYVEDLAQTVLQLPGTPILIGHSMGGFIVQKYLEQHTADAVVLLASVPPEGVLATTLQAARMHPLIFAKVNLTFSLAPLMATPALAHEFLFSLDMPDDEVLSYWKQMQDESLLAWLDMLAFNLPKPCRTTSPMLVLGGTNDISLKPGQIKATARAYSAHYEMVDGVAHDMMLDTRWQDVAQRIHRWLIDIELPAVASKT
jgi:pimeloyl-ACP methyl ester carboxylesterase